MDLLKIKIIGFDADDTLWVNEPYYRETENEFFNLLKDYGSSDYLSQVLLEVELNNIETYGFGIKAFILSLIETALKVSGNKLDSGLIGKIIALGKAQITRQNEILPETETVLKRLSGKYRLIVATKGDLLDQERKLKNSGLLPYFHHIEVMSNKKAVNYRQLLTHLDILPEEFLMVGNSLKSDVVPVLELGGNAIHIPFHTTWVYEDIPAVELPGPRFRKVDKISDILEIL